MVHNCNIFTRVLVLETLTKASVLIIEENCLLLFMKGRFEPLLIKHPVLCWMRDAFEQRRPLAATWK